MNLERELGFKVKGKLKRNEPMALHTSWRVGGPADYYLCPADLADLIEAIKFCRDHKLPFFVFGNGSNLLVSDKGIRGLVLNMGAPFAYVHCADGTVRAGAGTSMTVLAKTTAACGLGGLEFAVGIPGTLGGALIMNAGAFGGYIGEKVRVVRLVASSGEPADLNGSDLEFGYRTSNLPGRGVVYEVIFGLNPGSPERSAALMEHFLAERRRRHPELPSAGSVFRNPPDRPAGQLIEEAGGKGMRVGGAEVSEQHANFIVNRGGATAADILALIRAVRLLVREKHGLDLEPEIKIVGEES